MRATPARTLLLMFVLSAACLGRPKTPEGFESTEKPEEQAQPECNTSAQCAETDGNPCTAPVCNAEAKCIEAPVDDETSCNADDNLCTTGTCQSGVCQEEDVVCLDDFDCTVDSCDRSTGECVSVPDHTVCEDGVACTINLCNFDTGCEPPQPDHGFCDDSEPCTTDVCDVAAEVGTDGCLTEPTPLFGACDDGSDATGPDMCVNDVCTGGDSRMADVPGCQQHWPADLVYDKDNDVFLMATNATSGDCAGETQFVTFSALSAQWEAGTVKGSGIGTARSLAITPRYTFLVGDDGNLQVLGRSPRISGIGNMAFSGTDHHTAMWSGRFTAAAGFLELEELGVCNTPPCYHWDDSHTWFVGESGSNDRARVVHCENDPLAQANFADNLTCQAVSGSFGVDNSRFVAAVPNQDSGAFLGSRDYGGGLFLFADDNTSQLIVDDTDATNNLANPGAGVREMPGGARGMIRSACNSMFIFGGELLAQCTTANTGSFGTCKADMAQWSCTFVEHLGHDFLDVAFLRAGSLGTKTVLLESDAIYILNAGGDRLDVDDYTRVDVAAAYPNIRLESMAADNDAAWMLVGYDTLEDQTRMIRLAWPE